MAYFFERSFKLSFLLINNCMIPYNYLFIYFYLLYFYLLAMTRRVINWLTCLLSKILYLVLTYVVYHVTYIEFHTYIYYTHVLHSIRLKIILNIY